MIDESSFYIRKAILRVSWLVNCGMSGRNQYTEGLVRLEDKQRSEWRVDYEHMFVNAVTSCFSVDHVVIQEFIYLQIIFIISLK